MAYDNPAVVITDLTDTMPSELKGSYRGSNEFICKLIRSTLFTIA